MCGIAGLVNFRGGISPEVVSAASDLLRARGPDDAGVWAKDGAGFGHRRLSIIDLSSAAHQPMVSADGRYVIVFNGEIYNFSEIRRELGEDSYPWGSRSDTEVILVAYIRWGPSFLLRLRGMFAFAIWDCNKRSVFAARDRMGVKPFYYHHSLGRLFAFASRPRAVMALDPGIPDEIDLQALRYFLEIGYIPAPHSYSSGIKKLPPGHFLIVDSRGMRLEKYWDFSTIEPNPTWAKRKLEDLLDELDEVVSESVRLRLVSDVPLGAFLSGGIDSSLVVAMMRRHSASPVETFTIGFQEKAYDESAHAKKVADHLGVRHHVEHLRTDDLLDLMPTFLSEYDEPFFDSSAFPTMAVSRLARRFVTVSLSGDGGDELFGGYHYYRIAQALDPFFRLPRPVRAACAKLVGIFPTHRLRLLGAALKQESGAAAFAFSRSIAKDFGGVLGPEAMKATSSLRELFATAAARFPQGLSGAESAMRLDGLYTLPDEYLQKVDVASMAFSLEAREPMLDHRLVEWTMRLPLCLKLRGWVRKFLLRQLAYRYVPRKLLDRPKQGFGVPIDAWLRGSLRSWALERLNDKALFDDLPLDQAKTLELFALHESGARNVHPLLWAILVLIEFRANKSHLRRSA
jgi:asparagine synthase (glutamine-hydrolysing)